MFHSSPASIHSLPLSLSTIPGIVHMIMGQLAWKLQLHWHLYFQILSVSTTILALSLSNSFYVQRAAWSQVTLLVFLLSVSTTRSLTTLGAFDVRIGAVFTSETVVRGDSLIGYGFRRGQAR